jgi:hypothetical protein
MTDRNNKDLWIPQLFWFMKDGTLPPIFPPIDVKIKIELLPYDKLKILGSKDNKELNIKDNTDNKDQPRLVDLKNVKKHRNRSRNHKTRRKR